MKGTKPDRPETTDIEKFEDRSEIPVGSVVVAESPLMAAIKGGLDPALIEKLMDLRDREAAADAKAEFVRDMALFKKNPPEILKTAHVSYKNAAGKLTEWDHAELGLITEAINERLSEYNFFAYWDMTQPDKDTVKTTCHLCHSGGHELTMTMEGPPDTSGGKDALKAVASTNTIHQRLTLLAVTGLAAKGMDKESPSEGDIVTFIAPAQITILQAIIDKKNIDIAAVLRYAGADTIGKILASKFKDVKGNLDKAKAKPAPGSAKGEALK